MTTLDKSPNPPARCSIRCQRLRERRCCASKKCAPLSRESPIACRIWWTHLAASASNCPPQSRTERLKSRTERLTRAAEIPGKSLVTRTDRFGRRRAYSLPPKLRSPKQAARQNVWLASTSSHTAADFGPAPMMRPRLSVRSLGAGTGRLGDSVAIALNSPTIRSCALVLSSRNPLSAVFRPKFP